MSAENRGNYLKIKREQKKLSQQAVAEAVDVSIVTVSNWETGKTKDIKPGNLEKLLDVLEISYAQYFAGDDLAELSENLRKDLDEQIRELTERVGDVQNITISIEDHSIVSLDTAISAISIASISLSFSIWATFDHTALNKIICIIIGILGIAFLLFGRKVIRKLEMQFQERKTQMKK